MLSSIDQSDLRDRQPSARRLARSRALARDLKQSLSDLPSTTDVATHETPPVSVSYDSDAAEASESWWCVLAYARALTK